LPKGEVEPYNLLSAPMERRTMNMDDVAYSAHMDALMLKLSAVLDGETANDAAMVSAVSCAWAIYCGQHTHEKRMRLLDTMIAFMRSELKNLEATDGPGNLWKQ
jgi:hypothetical protein